MPFNLTFLTRMQQTEDLDKTLNPAQGVDTVRAPQMWSYNASVTGSNDAAAVVAAADYFLGARGYLSVNDLIWTSTTGVPGLYSVTTNTGASVAVTIRSV